MVSKRVAVGLAGVDHYLPYQSPAIRTALESLAAHQGFDYPGRMRKCAILTSPQLEEEILHSQRDLDPPGIARIDKAINLAGPRCRQAYQLLHIGIATDDPVERHDIGRRDVAGQIDKVPCW
jgi:hypothetical protein